MSVTPGVLISILETHQQIAQMIIDGLRGSQFRWKRGEGAGYLKIAKAQGVTLKTKTAITRDGRQLKDFAEPVGWIYYDSPVNKDCAVYVVECQTKALPAEEGPEEG